MKLIGYNLILIWIFLNIKVLWAFNYQQCALYQFESRHCLTPNLTCYGVSLKSSLSSYTTCPILNKAQVASAISDLQSSQQQQVTQVTQQTQQELAAVQVKYATSVSTSKSFGFIAGSEIIAFLGLLFLFPLMMDVSKFFIYRYEQKKLEKKQIRK